MVGVSGGVRHRVISYLSTLSKEEEFLKQIPVFASSYDNVSPVFFMFFHLGVL